MNRETLILLIVTILAGDASSVALAWHGLIPGLVAFGIISSGFTGVFGFVVQSSSSRTTSTPAGSSASERVG